MDISLDHALDGSGQDRGQDSPECDENVVLSHEAVHVIHQSDGEEQAAIASVAQGGLTLDPNIQYQLKAESSQGQVTYRVIQLAQGAEETHMVTGGTSAFVTNTPGVQAVIQSPFSNGGSPPPDGMGETRFTYVPTVGGALATETVAVTQPDTVINTASLGQVATGAGGETGQFYVMMSPQEVLQAGQRTLAPRTGVPPRVVETSRSSRDDRRRATHNEVERRRRDKINNWIVHLSKMIPNCGEDHTKQGQVRQGILSNNSKGGILAKACDYINEIRTANERMSETLKETERLSVDVELLRQQCDELKQENTILRTQLQQHGIVPTDLTGSNS